MRFFNTVMMAAGAAVLALGTSASAASFSIVGGMEDSIPFGDSGAQNDNSPQNDFLERFDLGSIDGGTGFFTLGGYSESSISLSETANVRIQVFGWQAGYFNSFNLGATSVGRGGADSGYLFADDLSTPLTDVTVADVTTALFDTFSFSSLLNDNATPAGSVSNGSANLLTGANFFASFGPGAEEAREGNMLWLFYDDFGVTGDNHDDLVILLSTIPLPAGLVLMLTGAGALALGRKRKAA